MRTGSSRATAVARRRLTIVLVAAATLAAACSSSSGRDAVSQTTTASGATSAAPTTGPAARTCDQAPTIDPVQAAPVDDPKLDHDWTITSFDETRIRAHWFPVDGATEADPAPTVLMGPGWSLAGDTSERGGTLFAALSIEATAGVSS